ncbi:MAG TPA: VWA domain-containing protein [Bryobacteraceae bacterium]|nr:VWA domain-containing protein [Bryobacteraceae bacterium]
MGVRTVTGVFFLLAGAVWAQVPSEPEVSAHETPITFSSRVNLISVPVVVRDKDGRAVGNLKKEDFEVFDKGKLQTITKFALEESKTPADAGARAAIRREIAPSAAATLPERYVAYLVDDVHLDPGDLLNARQAMHRHLDESLEPASRSAIFTTSGITLIDFSGDREKLHEAVNKIQPYTSGIDPHQDCPYISYYVADLLGSQRPYLGLPDQALFQMMGPGEPELTAAFEETTKCEVCNTPGKDSMTGLPLCTVYYLRKLRAAIRQSLTYGEHESSLGLAAARDVIRKLSVIPGNRNLVLVSPGFLLTRDHRANEYDLFERAIRANVVINTIDMRGLFTIIPGGHASDKSYASALGTTFLAQSNQAAATQAQDVLAELANATGGTFFHNDNDLKGGLNIIAARPEYVYVLGFSPQELKYDGAYHSLKVTVKRAGSTIQARRGYWAPAHAVDSAEAAKEQIQETVFSRDEVHGIPLEIQTEFFESGDARYDLTVTAQLDAKALRFAKTGDRNIDTVTVVAGIFDPNGNYVTGIEKVVALHLRDRTLAAFEAGGMNVKEDFTIAPGRYLVRVVVEDAGGKNITAKNTGVEIP